MQVFNQHKAELIRIIDQKVTNIDHTCNQLSNQIYQYSEERLQSLQKQRDEQRQAIQSLKKQKQTNSKIITDLYEHLQFLEKEQQSIVRKVQEKERDNQDYQRQLVFCEEKNKEETPHIQHYLTELSKAQSSNIKVQYAKDRLKELQIKYRKQSEAVQEKYYKIQLMRTKLTQYRQIQNNISKHSKDTAQSYFDPSSSINYLNPASMPKKTEISQIEGSAIYTYREEQL